ncbi:pentapeptide repeat-containing protein [Pseudomonas sp. F1_0610]|uniref:pentapeptide repeat-containing protein n=1 Tax=Pseudomonas sp. F1_0610 TaxID=3114284 RepID=UPI0039C3AB1A
MKKILQTKWSSPHFLEYIQPHLAALASASPKLNCVDFSGIVIGPDSDLDTLRGLSLHQAQIKAVNFSHAVLATSFNHSCLEQVDFAYAQLDYCAFNQARIEKSSFLHAQILANMDDVVCVDCIFDSALFIAGMAGMEFGGRRATFINCDFTAAIFQAVAFRAARFIDCTFYKTQFVSCDLRGMKVQGGTALQPQQFKLMTVPKGVC